MILKSFILSPSLSGREGKLFFLCCSSVPPTGLLPTLCLWLNSEKRSSALSSFLCKASFTEVSDQLPDQKHLRNSMQVYGQADELDLCLFTSTYLRVFQVWKKNPKKVCILFHLFRSKCDELEVVLCKQTYVIEPSWVCHSPLSKFRQKLIGHRCHKTDICPILL